MRLIIRFVLISASALLLSLLKKWPNNSKNEGDDSQHKPTSTNDGQQPADEMLHAEWSAFQALIREIHESEKRHQKAERKLGAAQLRTAKGLNRITIIGAIVNVLGLLGVAASIFIAKQAADDGHTVADATAIQARTIIETNKAFLSAVGLKIELQNRVDYGTGWDIRASIQNSGAIPTGRGEYKFSYFIIHEPRIGFYISSRLNTPPNPSRLIASQRMPLFIGPHVTLDLRGAVMEEATGEGIYNGVEAAFVLGILQYNDGFANTPLHTTMFCYRIGIRPIM